METSSTAPRAPTPTVEELLPPSPPSTPPRISFDPPLFLQRRTAVHAILRQLSSSPRFSGKLRSVLDVGCGTDCLLLRSLIPCEDDIPLERITGIDFDEGLFHPDVAESVAPGSFGGTGGAEDRWRPLDFSLLQGSFEHLTPKTVPRHDIIVSTEVIEHLDPQPVSHFAPVLLGKMKPKICVVTTPNRDFNRVFEIPFTPPHNSPVARPALNNDANLPNIESIINGAHEQPKLGIDSIIESTLNQPMPKLVSGKSIIDALEAAVSETEDRKVDGTEFMFDNPPSRSESPQLAPDNHDIAGDSERRFWRTGIPYPMRHHDHRFEWTRAEFREWAKTAAEQFGYDVVFTGVGSLDCGMSVVGTGWAIERSLEDAEDTFFEDEQNCLRSISIGDNKVLGEGLEDLIGKSAEEMGTLAREAKAVYGDCSQIAVFVIKESTEAEWDSVEGFVSTADRARNLRARTGSRSEGTAKPVFPDAWAPLITPDNWFSLPFFTAPDIRLVCHYSYPFLENEEYPPPYIRMLEMVQETFISFLPALVLEEWQKTPAVLAREERAREAEKDGVLYRPVLENMDLDPDDFYEPPTAEVLKARAKAKKIEEEKERCRVKRQIEIMGGMKAEDVQAVKMVLGTKEVWNSSYKLQRAFRFHYDVFRRLFTGAGEEVVESSDSLESAEWKTIIDTTGDSTILQDSEYHSTEQMIVELQGQELIRMTLNPPGTINNSIDEYSGPDIFNDNTEDTQSYTPTIVPDDPTDEKAFWEAWENAGSCCSIPDEDPGNVDSRWDGNWYHDDEAPKWQALKLHVVAAWSHGDLIPQCKGKGKEKPGENRVHRIKPRDIEARMGIDIDEGILRVGRNGKASHGEDQEEAMEWQEGDVPVVITYFKPVRITNDYSNNYNGAMEENSYEVQGDFSAFDGTGDEVEGPEWNNAAEGMGDGGALMV